MHKRNRTSAAFLSRAVDWRSWSVAYLAAAIATGRSALPTANTAGADLPPKLLEMSTLAKFTTAVHNDTEVILLRAERA